MEKVQTITAPQGMKFLHVANVGGMPTIYGEVDPENEEVGIEVRVLATGHDLSVDMERFYFVGTTVHPYGVIGDLVWHIYLPKEVVDGDNLWRIK